MTTPFPAEELRRLGLTREGIGWAQSLGERLDMLEDIIAANGDVLMPVSSTPIDTAFITGTTSSEQTILTAADNTVTILKKIVLCNTHTSAITVSAWLIPEGQSLGDGYLVIDELSIDSDTTVEPTGLQNRLLSQGTVFKIKASTASKVTLGGNYIQRVRER